VHTRGWQLVIGLVWDLVRIRHKWQCFPCRTPLALPHKPCATSGLIIKTRIIPGLTLTLIVTGQVIHGIICVHDPVDAERMPGSEQSGKFLLGQIVEDTVSLFLLIVK
jgi:hypothetical protein